MAFEHKLNTASLFTNKYKDTESKPDYKGSGNFNGKVMDLAGWKKTLPDGTVFLSLKISESYQKEPHQQRSDSEPVDDTDCPF